MIICRTQSELDAFVLGAKKNNETIGFVPTMGALHAGHLSLITAAQQHSDVTIVSIFVNPKQFGPNEDFDNYPRTEADDLKSLEAASVTAVYMPVAAEFYPENHQSTIDVGPIGTVFEGEFRPGFFNGVATVVCKLLCETQADIAVFGEKDFQQLHIIKQLVRDFSLPCRIIASPIIREDDGLAMSSRNRRLSASKRSIAPAVFRSLISAAEQITAGANEDEVLFKETQRLEEIGFDKVDYFELVSADSLQPTNYTKGSKTQLIIAARLEKIRILDTISL